MRDLELWAGAECTVSRVGDRFNDQLCLTGHHGRPDDLGRLQGLGISAWRLPLLWERIAPDRAQQRDWRWTDRCLDQLKQAEIRPIGGLIHHGSGPIHTSLLDGKFAAGLAAHAQACAERYPWIEEWSPVNEPLTTARFACLYGHWYPHRRDERSFWTALLNQIDAVRLSMAAIRSVIPDARLLQPEDLGRTYATAALADQAGFDNARRWLTWDLLCGRVSPRHPFWQRLCDLGFESRLRAILDDPCPPDSLGIDHYLTSDRFLDHRLQLYPAAAHGGNGRQVYADVAAVRVLDPAPAGLRDAIAECWERYRLPLVLSEVHNGCTREEQLRWFHQAWKTAAELRREGADIRAVTAWAAFGSQGWNTLATAAGKYEPGLFDVRAPEPRSTALGNYLGAKHRRAPAHPVASEPGWWNRPGRLQHRAVPRPATMGRLLAGRPAHSGPPILILGATGTLGQALAAECRHRNLAHVLLSRSEMDLTSAPGVERALELHRPWAVMNAAGWVRVDEAEAEPEACMKANTTGPLIVARACERRGIPTVNFSSDLVFGANRRRSYRESDLPAPANIYAASKRAMEIELSALAGAHLIVRTAGFFSPFDRFNFAVQLCEALGRGEAFAATEDCVVSPTYVPDLCAAILDLLLDGETGVWHLSNRESLSWAAFGKRVAVACRLDPALVAPVSATEMGWRAARPGSSGLSSEKSFAMPTLASAIERFGEAMRGRA